MTRSHGALDRFHWLVTVKDPAGRGRDVLVGVRAGAVVTLVPPGEGFSQTPEGARELAAHYAAAASVAEKDALTVSSSRRVGAATDHPSASHSSATAPPPPRSAGPELSEEGGWL